MGIRDGASLARQGQVKPLLWGACGSNPGPSAQPRAPVTFDLSRGVAEITGLRYDERLRALDRWQARMSLPTPPQLPESSTVALKVTLMALLQS